MAIMPQLDILSFFSQSIWLTVILTIFFITLFVYLPNFPIIFILFLHDFFSKIFFVKNMNKTL